MIIKKNIIKTLTDLNKLYNQSMTMANQNNAIFFSKLAILEYCGWIEHSFDVIVYRTALTKLKTQKYKDILTQRIVENNFGFEYKKNFRPMMIQAIGIVEMEKLETTLNVLGHLPVLISELESVKTERDSAAHTYLHNLLITYSSPSVTIERLNKVYPIMKFIFTHIRTKV